jgi:parallel beta-helix repeat protein
MLNSLFRSFFKRRPNRQNAGRSRVRTRLRLEALEDRLVPTTWNVGAHETLTSISAALNVASANDTISVDPGVYQEQVAIAKNGIKLVANNPAVLTKILAPASATGSIVDITGTKVVVKGFTIDGGGNSAGLIESAVRVEDGASATIRNNHITDLFNGTDNQSGFGIRVGTATTTVATSAKILDNVIDSYQKGGIVVDGSGASAIVSGNTVTGGGPLALVAQNGIQVSDNASASVTFNTVTENQYTGSDFISVGILVFNDTTGSVVVAQNYATQNETGVSTAEVNGTVVLNNDISSNTLDGIDMFSSTGTLVRHNDIENNGLTTSNGLQSLGYGIFMSGCNNNDARWNEVSHNGSDGIHLESSNSNLLTADESTSNGGVGILLLNSNGNTIEFSAVIGNGGNGIQLIASSNNTIIFNIVAGNAGTGIVVDAQSLGNNIQANIVVDNGDGNYSVQLGVGGNNNTWQTYQNVSSYLAALLADDC